CWLPSQLNRGTHGDRLVNKRLVGCCSQESPTSKRSVGGGSVQNPFEQTRLEKGMVLAIEPFISTGDELVEEAGDGWTLVAPQGSLVAQFEHTIVVTEEEPIILTAWP
ncbi:M24 family metallopeptidase, partial [Caldalkalibacillus thermarum]|uniref:M24 family metallopeptidase n=1 Tax=Caldalkalibacillus thermarum TaxID=296745 RepID=UPI00166DD4A3